MKHLKHFDTDEATSQRMSKIKHQKGDAEILLAKQLWHKGFRYRLNDKTLPGSPDIAILKYHIAVFVDGEFWHGYNWDERKPRLKRNREYWIQKIEENMERDTRVDKELIAMEWTPLHFWSKQVMREADVCVDAIEETILQNTLQEFDYV